MTQSQIERAANMWRDLRNTVQIARVLSDSQFGSGPRITEAEIYNRLEHIKRLALQ